MMISVIIPAVNPKLTYDLLRTIVDNSLTPTEIIIINNSLTNTDLSFTLPLPLPPKIINSPTPGKLAGTNECWNLGLSHLSDHADLVCILNDDLLLNPNFFSKLQTIMQSQPHNCLGAIPTPVKRPSRLSSVPLTENSYSITSLQRGYCMCFRPHSLLSLPPIPSEMRIFYGDRWWFACALTLGFHWLWMTDNPVYHYGSYTTKRQPYPEIHSQRLYERSVFRREFRLWRSRLATVTQ